MRKSSTVTLGGKKYVIERAKLKSWLQLEDLREEIIGAADREDREGLIAKIYSYLSVAVSDNISFAKLPWFEVVFSYIELTVLNLPSHKFPLLRMVNDVKEKIGWNYEGRTWYAWAHTLAEVYGWSLEYIAELDIDDAIAMIEEIAVKDQLEKEWEWALSDKSVSYDKQGKGTFKELPRPTWMIDVSVHIPRKSPIKKSMIPVGNVVQWNKDEAIDA